MFKIVATCIYTKWIFYFAFLLHLYFQGVLGFQEFILEPSSHEVNPNTVAHLKCIVKQLKGECSWQKNGKPIGMQSGKYDWAGMTKNGDCSIIISDVTLQYDDGEWRCQVTASDYATQDALSSRIAKLVVRETPKTITISAGNENQMQSREKITVVDGKVQDLRCISSGSNPAPKLSWYLGDRRLRTQNQLNTTESGDGSSWRAVSSLTHAFKKEDFGKSIVCRVYHEAYPLGRLDKSVPLDVQYKPVVSISRNVDNVLEENRGSARLMCKADANPAANITWRKMGGTREDRLPRSVEQLEFRPVKRKDSGTYICQGVNSVGVSSEVATDVNVLYGPKILRVTPIQGETVGVHNRTVLTCTAEGNPIPKYQWLQKLSSENVLKRGFDSKLIIDDISYDHQGDYVCAAYNIIGDQKKQVQSEPIKIQVIGAPQVVRYSVDREVEAISGRDVRLEMEVCSDPLPTHTSWDWGSLRVEAGKELHGRFLAEQMVEHPEREDCYVARLIIKHVNPIDSRRYFLEVSNQHGSDRFAVALTVRDPVSMASVIGVVIALLVLFVFLVIVLLCSYKKRKLCFKESLKQNKGSSVEKHGFDTEKANGHLNGGNGKNPHGNSITDGGLYHHYDDSSTALSRSTSNAMLNHTNDQIWPDNSPYQVYVPGYTMTPSPRNITSENINTLKSPSVSNFPRSHSNTPNSCGNGILYAELQFPVTSNYGSMKKRSNKRKTTNSSVAPLNAIITPCSNRASMANVSTDPNIRNSYATNVDATIIGNGTGTVVNGGGSISSSQSLENVYRFIPTTTNYADHYLNDSGLSAM